MAAASGCRFELAALVRAKIYLLAITVFIVWIKTLEHLRVNSSLSTFILIIKGMLGKLSSFFIILAFSLVAFAGLEYVAFGLHFDDGATLLLSLIRGFNGALVCSAWVGLPHAPACVSRWWRLVHRAMWT